MKKYLLVIAITGFSGFLCADRGLSNSRRSSSSSSLSLPSLAQGYVFVEHAEDPLDEDYLEIVNAIQDAQEAQEKRASRFSKAANYAVKYVCGDSYYKKIARAFEDFFGHMHQDLGVFSQIGQTVQRIVADNNQVIASLKETTDCNALQELKSSLVMQRSILAGMKESIAHYGRLFDKMFDHCIVYSVLLEERNGNNAYSTLLKRINEELGNLVITRTKAQQFDGSTLLDQAVEKEAQRVTSLYSTVLQKIAENEC